MLRGLAEERPSEAQGGVRPPEAEQAEGQEALRSSREEAPRADRQEAVLAQSTRAPA